MRQHTEAVQRMQDYIDAHLDERISPAALARAAGFSPWHARRMFKALTGLSPAGYIRRLRLSRSALRLRDDPARIADVAMDMGYGSVDGYQRAFAREFGCNPKAYAANPVPLPLFTPYGVGHQLPKEGIHMAADRRIDVKQETRAARKALIRRGVKATEYWSYCEEVGCELWGLLTSIRSPFGEPVCLWLPEALVLPGTSVYVQGVEVSADYDGPVPEGLEAIDLPEARYLRFQGEPFEEALFAQAIQEVWQAERDFDPASLGLQWDADNPRIQLEPIGARGYIELVPVKPADA